MLLVLKPTITPTEVEHLMQKLSWMGLQVVPTQNAERYTLAIIYGADHQVKVEQFLLLPGVAEVLPFQEKYKLTSRSTKNQRTKIYIKDKCIGDENQLTIMAGPCSIESEEQMQATAEQVAAAGAMVLRGGAFKPRTSPYEFQGLGKEGLRLLQAAGKQYKLLTISEVMSIEQIESVANHVDILQIGARNMQNFNLLKAVGETQKPILLKRGLSATYHEFLLAAEYILSTGNSQVMLCERGIRTFETYTRNTLDIAAVPVLQALSHLPIIIDPSHAVGIRQFVPALARAAVAVGAQGVMIEIHPCPEKALSDGPQSLTFPQFQAMAASLHQLSKAMQATVDCAV